MTMRAALPLAVLATLAFSGVASASDYMLPALLDQRGAAAPEPAPPADQAQTVTLGPAASNGAMVAALLASALVIGVVFVGLARASRARN